MNRAHHNLIYLILSIYASKKTARKAFDEVPWSKMIAAQKTVKLIFWTAHSLDFPYLIFYSNLNCRTTSLSSSANLANCSELPATSSIELFVC